jgi:hypothetical protein
VSGMSPEDEYIVNSKAVNRWAPADRSGVFAYRFEEFIGYSFLMSSK